MPLSPSALTALLDHARDRLAVPGVCVGMVVGGEPVLTGASGWADLDRQEPATTTQRSRWYSLTKPLTALLLLDLHAQGRIDLDAPLSGFVPDLAFDDPRAQAAAALRDCLLHRTGLGSGDWTWDGGPRDPARSVALIRHLPCGTFRDGFQYQNLHFAIIDRALAARGIDWHQAIRSLLAAVDVDPVTRTADFIAGPRLAPHGPNGLGPARTVADVDMDGVPAAGGLCGSIEELTRVTALVAGSGRWRGRTVIPGATWNAAMAPAIDRQAGPWAERISPKAALAGEWSRYRDRDLIAWAGGFRGHTAHLMAIPSLGIGACALGNRGASPVADALALTLIDRAAGWAPIPWVERYAEAKRKALADAARQREERLARPVAPWPTWTMAGVYRHPAYGDLRITGEADAATLHFRHRTLPMIPRRDGRMSADADADDGDAAWDLEPLVEGGRVVSWRWNPDDARHPLVFSLARE